MTEGRLLIRGLSTVSSLGATAEVIGASFARNSVTPATLREDPTAAVFPLAPDAEARVSLVVQDERFARLDRATVLALAAARETLRALDTDDGDLGCVTIGSARGATASLERTYEEFLQGDRSKVGVHTSPVTTAGNTSAWIAQSYLEGLAQLRGAHQRKSTAGAAILANSTSMTCTSGFHSLLVALAFVRAGLTRVALFGGTEACLTPYTVAQLRALRIYAHTEGDHGDARWPCRPCYDDSTQAGPAGRVVLGEGAGTALLMRCDGAPKPGDLVLEGIGWALEETPSPTGVSADGAGFEAAIRMALAGLPPGEAVDAVVLHAPGTVRGDGAELVAVRRALGETALFTTKHLTGHTYGASGMISLELARYLLDGGRVPELPYPNVCSFQVVKTIERVLVTTAGFGGNTISVVVGRGA